MDGFIGVIPGVSVGPGSLSVATAPDLCRGIFEGHNRRTHGIEGDAVATSPAKLNVRLARENPNFGSKHDRTSHPDPCSPYNRRVGQTAEVAVCGFYIDEQVASAPDLCRRIFAGDNQRAHCLGGDAVAISYDHPHTEMRHVCAARGRLVGKGVDAQADCDPEL